MASVSLLPNAGSPSDATIAHSVGVIKVLSVRNGSLPVGLLWLLHERFYTNEPRTLKCTLFFISLCLMQCVRAGKTFHFMI